MSEYNRFAVYYLPPEGPLARFGASWLGWDVSAGTEVPHPPSSLDVSAITATPRKYGFHGTLKPPFRLAPGTTREDLEAKVATVAGTLPAVHLDALAMTRLGRFLALTPQGDTTALAHVASTLVRDLDTFRAPPSESELIRRRVSGLTDRQEGYLLHWGYPYVLEDFRFHLTLTGKLGDTDLPEIEDVLRPLLGPIDLAPHDITEVALCGERPDGRFEELHRYALTG